jgi:hypothetical protein
MVAASGTVSMRAALATMTACSDCAEKPVRVAHRQRVDGVSSPAVGSSSRMSGRPDASPAAIHTLRFEPVESMNIFLSRCGASAKPSAMACHFASLKPASPSTSEAVHSRAVSWSKRSVTGSTKNTWRRYASGAASRLTPATVSRPMAGSVPAITWSSADLPVPVSP